MVDTFLLSCRALGRGVEHRMVARLGEIALERGLARVEIPFVAGQRNRPARAVPGIDRSAERADRGRLPRPCGTRAAQSPDSADSRSRRARGRVRSAPRINYLEDRHRTAHPGRDSRARSAPPPASRRGRASEPPRTPLERELAELWAGLLNIPAVGVHDNFFELGGHSLLAVQLLSRVRQIYGVELSLEVVYSGEFTVAELAKAVELKEIEQSGADYQDLLAGTGRPHRRRGARAAGGRAGRRSKRCASC